MNSNRSILTLLVAALVVLGLGPAAPLAAQECRRTTLAPAPFWAFSGAWSPDGSSLQLVDVARKAVLSYQLDETPGSIALGSADVDSSNAGRLSLLQSWRDGYLLEGADGELQQLSADFQPVVQVGNVLAGAKFGLKSLDSWASDGEHLLVYGDYQHFSGRWVSVFARVSLDDPGNLQIIKWIPADDPARRFYLNAQNYLTVSEGRGYFLYLGEDPGIWEVDMERGDLRRLTHALPQQFRHRIVLPELRGIDSVRDVYGAQERATAAVGLFAQDGLLYVLGRAPSADAAKKTRWTMTVVDPVEDRALRTLRLPTQSPHLLVIPGARQWAFVEKGSVTGLGNQPVSHAVTLPASWLTAADSPLLKPQKEGLCQ